MKALLLYFIAPLFVSVACNNSAADKPNVENHSDRSNNDRRSRNNDRDQNRKDDRSRKSGNRDGDVIQFSSHQVMDREGTGMVASTYLLPADWKVTDKFYWEYKDPTVPIRYEGISTNRDGSMMIQMFSEQGRYWATGPSGTQGYAPPADIVEGLKFMIKVERKGMNVRFVDSKILARTSSREGPGSTSSAQAGVVKVSYEEKGQQMEEEFYGQLYQSDVRTQTALGNTRAIVWRARALYSCKARMGKLDECRQIAQTLQSSATPTKQFFNKLMQVMQLLSDQFYQRIFQAGQLSKLISATNDRMIANIDASYRRTQEATDRVNDQFSNYIRSVEPYDDGNGNVVKLPVSYGGAWVNNQGEYVVSKSGDYDPSEDYSGNWRRLSRDR